MAPLPTHSALDDEPNALYRGAVPRVAKVRAISSSDRLLRPTKASLAATRSKVLTGRDKELAEAQKRRRLARLAKQHGRLTVPQSPKFRPLKMATLRSRADQLTRTSRELLEIDAIRKRVQAQKRKTQKYHDATTHGAAKSGRSDQFSRALSASGGVGVPAVRRPKLTTPVGFAFAIDKRAEARKSLKRTRGSLKVATATTATVDGHEEEAKEVDEKVNVIAVDEEGEKLGGDKKRRRSRRVSTVDASE